MASAVTKRLGLIVPSSCVMVLKGPVDFYQQLCEGVATARERVSLASLYMDNLDFRSIIKSKAAQGVPVSFVLDANRALRKNKQKDSSITGLSPSIINNGTRKKKNCEIIIID